NAATPAGQGPEAQQDKKDQPGKPAVAEPQDKDLSPATRLVEAVLDPALGVELFTDEAGRQYLPAPVAGRRETGPVRSEDCRQWLTRVYYHVEDAVLTAATRENVLAHLESEARFSSQIQKVFVRVGEHEGSIYLDLGVGMSHATRLF